MYNISFKAELKVNNNLYENLPKGTSKEFPSRMVSEFRDFLNHPKMKKATEGDTIELSRAKHRGGFAVELKYLSDSLEKPYETGIYTNNKLPDIKTSDLKYWTYRFLCEKKGEKPKTFESSFRFIERVLFDGKKVFRK